VKKLLIGAFALCCFFAPALLAQENDADMIDVQLITHFDTDNEVPADMSAEYGSRMALDGHLAENPDYEFGYWIVNGVVHKHLPVDHEFTVRSTMEITAIFKPVDQHFVTFMDTNGDLLDIQYVDAGESVTYEGLKYPDKPNLKVAEEPWGDVNLDSVNEDKILCINYVRDTDETFTLEYKDEPFMGDFITEEYDFNEVVELNAGNVNAFDYWKLNGEIASYEPTFKFSILDDVEVEAIFSGDTVEPEPVIVSGDDLQLREGSVTHMAQFYLPEDYELIEYGFVSTPHAFDNVTLENENVDRHQGDKFFGPTNEFLMSLDEENVQNPRAYLVYRDAEGELDTVYSESKHHVVAEREIEERDLDDDVITMWIPNPLNDYFMEWTPYIDDQAIDGFEVRSDGSIFGPAGEVDQINFVGIDGIWYPIEEYDDTTVIGDGE